MTVKDLLQHLVDFPNEYEVKIALPALAASGYTYRALEEVDEEARTDGNVCLLIAE